MGLGCVCRGGGGGVRGVGWLGGCGGGGHLGVVPVDHATPTLPSSSLPQTARE